MIRVRFESCYAVMAFITLVFTGLFSGALLAASAQPLLAGMMGGGGMMGPGMMMNQIRQPATSEETTVGNNLRVYVATQHLSCYSCHATETRGAGPSFMDIAKRYAGSAGTETILANSIAQGVAGKWSGYPGMPGGLASPAQARELAKLILSLGNHPQ